MMVLCMENCIITMPPEKFEHTSRYGSFICIPGDVIRLISQSTYIRPHGSSFQNSSLPSEVWYLLDSTDTRWREEIPIAVNSAMDDCNANF